MVLPRVSPSDKKDWVSSGESPMNRALLEVGSQALNKSLANAFASADPSWFISAVEGSGVTNSRAKRAFAALIAAVKVVALVAAVSFAISEAASPGSRLTPGRVWYCTRIFVSVPLSFMLP